MSDKIAKNADEKSGKATNKPFSALKRKSDDELKEQLLTLRREQFNMRFRQAQGQLEATHSLRVARREVARIKTLQNQKKQKTAAAKD